LENITGMRLAVDTKTECGNLNGRSYSLPHKKKKEVIDG
jgi:hypothetical protein